MEKNSWRCAVGTALQHGWRLFFISFLTAFYLAVGEDYPSMWHSGSQYALVQAMGKQKTFRIDDYRAPAGWEFAVKDGVFYSSKNPGLPFLALPFYTLAQRILPEKEDPRRKEGFLYLSARLVPAFFGALAVLLFWLLLKEYGVPKTWAILGAAALALGSQCAIYASHLYPHSFSTAAALGALWLWPRAKRDKSSALLLGFWMGTAVSVELSNGFLVFFVALAVLVSFSQRHRWFFFMALTAGVAPLLLYNTVCFGAPWLTSYHFLPNKGHEGFDIMRGPNGKVVFKLLFSTTEHPRAGLFLLNPMALLFPAAFYWFVRKKQFAMLWFFCTAPFSWLIALSGFEGYSSGSSDSIRYLAQTEALLGLAGFLGVGLFLRWVSPWERVLFGAAGMLLAGWQVLLHAYFWSPMVQHRYFSAFVSQVLFERDFSVLWEPRIGVSWNGDIFVGSGSVLLLFVFVVSIVWEYLKKKKVYHEKKRYR